MMYLSFQAPQSPYSEILNFIYVAHVLSHTYSDKGVYAASSKVSMWIYIVGYHDTFFLYLKCFILFFNLRR